MIYKNTNKNLIQIVIILMIKSNIFFNVIIFKLFFVIVVEKKTYIIYVILNLNEKFKMN